MNRIRIFDIFKQSGQKIKGNLNRKFLTYLLFLLIAVAVWYLNALNKNYTADFKFSVKYTDLPEDKVLATTPPEHLTLTISAQGFILLKYQFGLIFSPITLEVSYNTLRRIESPRGEYYLISQPAFNRIAAKLSSDVNLKHITPDTLNFIFTETIRKNIPVKPLVKFQFEKGFLPTGNMLVEPAKITVTGPKTVIDTMQYVYTKTRVFKNLKDTLSASLDLQPVHQLRYSTDGVNIVQSIERHTEATITVPIEPVNLPEGLTMKVFPGTVTVNCLVPIASYEKLQPYVFRAVVDYMSVKDEKDNQAKAKVALLRTPDYVTDVKFHPVNVDFIIEK